MMPSEKFRCCAICIPFLQCGHAYGGATKNMMLALIATLLAVFVILLATRLKSFNINLSLLFDEPNKIEEKKK